LQGLVKDQLVSTVPYIKNDIKNSNLTWVGLRKYAGKYITDNKVLEAMHIPQCGDKDCNINSDPTAYIFPENIKTANVEVKGTIDIKNKTFDVDSFVDITFKNDLSAPTITDTCTGLTCDFKVSNIAAYKSTPVDLYWMSDNKTLGKSKSTSGNGSFSYTFTSDKTPVSITAYAETSDNNRSVDSNKLSVFAPEVTVTATASQSTVEEGKTITLTANATLPDGVTVKSYSWALPSGWEVSTGSLTAQSVVVKAPKFTGTSDSYKFAVTVTDSSDREVTASTDNVTVTSSALNKPTASITGPSNVTENKQLVLKASATLNDKPVVDGTYKWTVPAGVTATGQDTDTLTVANAPGYNATSSANNYTFSVVAETKDGVQSDSAKQDVTVDENTALPAPTVDITGDTTVDSGKQLTLTANAVASGNRTIPENGYKWTIPAGFTVASGTAQDEKTLVVTAPAYSASAPEYTFSVTANDSAGDTGQSEYHIVTVNPYIIKQYVFIWRSLDNIKEEDVVNAINANKEHSHVSANIDEGNILLVCEPGYGIKTANDVSIQVQPNQTSVVGNDKFSMNSYSWYKTGEEFDFNTDNDNTLYNQVGGPTLVTYKVGCGKI
jgi:hypothetical protein